jgi:hypothetical protein
MRQGEYSGSPDVKDRRLSWHSGVFVPESTLARCGAESCAPCAAAEAPALRGARSLLNAPAIGGVAAGRLAGGRAMTPGDLAPHRD